MELDQIALLVMTWHTRAFRCRTAYESAARDHASTRCQSNAPSSSRLEQRDVIPYKCRPTLALQPPPKEIEMRCGLRHVPKWLRSRARSGRLQALVGQRHRSAAQIGMTRARCPRWPGIRSHSNALLYAMVLTKPRQHTSTLERIGHDQKALPVIARHKTTSRCLRAHESSA